MLLAAAATTCTNNSQHPADRRTATHQNRPLINYGVAAADVVAPIELSLMMTILQQQQQQQQAVVVVAGGKEQLSFSTHTACCCIVRLLLCVRLCASHPSNSTHGPSIIDPKFRCVTGTVHSWFIALLLLSLYTHTL